jgi:hypothetical protein
MGKLKVQKVLSKELFSRNFLIYPPEPQPSILISSPSESIYIGKTSLLNIPFFWNPKKLINPHICVVGITGSGKSYFVKTFITRARLVLNSNILILDWVGEYNDWVKSAGGRVIDFGKQGINIMDIENTDKMARLQQVINAFRILTDIEKYPKQLTITYEALLESYKTRKNPTLRDVVKILAKKQKDLIYKLCKNRIENLLASSGNSFCSKDFNINSLTKGLVCVDLHNLPTEQQRSLAGLTILQFIKEYMRKRPSNKIMPELFVIIDEAWKIAADERSDVISIIREGRKYGFSIIIASQNPSDIHKTIFSNAGTVFSFRLILSSEREYLRSSLSYSEYYELQSQRLAVGQALVHIETAFPVNCSRDFIIKKIEGEPLVELLYIKWGKNNNMQIELEKNKLLKFLTAFGLSDKQIKDVLYEFERQNNSLSAENFVKILERLNYPKATIISLLREMGAEEEDLLELFSHISSEEQISFELKKAESTKK